MWVGLARQLAVSTDVSGTHSFPAPLCSMTDWGQCIKQRELRLQCRGSAKIWATCVAWASPFSVAELGGRVETTLGWHPSWHPTPYPVPRS